MSGETSILLLLLGISFVFYLFRPQKINHFYGYRTKKSMKNIENWKKANNLASKGLLYLVAINVLLSILLTQFLKLSSLKILAVILIIEFIGLFYFVEKSLD